MFAYPIIIAAMIASGLFIGWINFSYLWGMIPAVIGGFCGSYYSKFGRMLLKPGIDDYQREKNPLCDPCSDNHVDRDLCHFLCARIRINQGCLLICCFDFSLCRFMLSVFPEYRLSSVNGISILTDAPTFFPFP